MNIGRKSVSKICSPDRLHSLRSSNKSSFLEHKRKGLKKTNAPLKALLKNLHNKAIEDNLAERRECKIAKHSSLENTRIKLTKNILSTRLSIKQINKSQLNSSKGIKSDRILLTKNKEIYIKRNKKVLVKL